MTVTNHDNYCAWSADLPGAGVPIFQELEPMEIPPKSRERKSSNLFSMWFLTITAVKVWNMSHKGAQISDEFFSSKKK